ncbi:NUC153 domain-containing protein [Dictyostelium discoideum AX4]|uniref:NUC153 domain-containing protein n=1 Tax=Dictyostelium discoideum TaxID=44689 RepID=Q54D60_DICDI|nr:NUC153 domain-containing protein [Dictyostelium discoideum AX4]EAL61212.1 NUC153 domain-containing protein [Dictyostelium discoideum AX4]|eukprot:XP_629636.1 NUC153 domain-containing protein [Dictyostelium discoideum AX4]
MNLLTTNGVKIYNVSAGKSLPEWLSENKREELRKNKEFNQRIELIQDFSFETSSQRVRISQDGQYIMATGIYPPQFKVFELSQLSQKVSRNLDCNVVTFEMLSDDYSKPVFLRDDRYIEFHAKFGSYFKTRIPKLGRDMTYHKPSCDLYITASDTEVYRLNLEEGRFLAPLTTHLNGGINVIAQNPVHQLMMLGGENGFIECWDPRVRTMVSTINAAAALPDYNSADEDSEPISITAGKFGPDGLLLGLGTSNGGVLMYDIRSASPSMIKMHQYQLPINSINFHISGDGTQRIMSSDAKIFKSFEKDTGKIHMVLEPKNPITDVVVTNGSGLLLMPGNTQKIQTYYVPALGAAPRWCSFLDNLTEELEEDKQLVYEDYKFITRDEVAKLDIENLIGTGYLKAYMHGYFIHIKLYNKVVMSKNPTNYEDLRKQQIKDKLAEKNQTRISLTKKPTSSSSTTINKPAVNAKLAERLAAQYEIQKQDSHKPMDAEITQSSSSDPRFKAMFENRDFEQDEGSEAFLRVNPRSKISKLDKHIQDNFDKVDFDDEDSDDDNDDDDDDQDNYKNKNRNSDSEDSDDDDDYDEDDIKIKSNPITNKRKELQKEQIKSKKPIKMYEIKTGHSLPSLNGKESGKQQILKSAPFSVRVGKEIKKATGLDDKDEKDGTKITKKDNGDLEIAFIPSASKKNLNNKSKKVVKKK